MAISSVYSSVAAGISAGESSFAGAANDIASGDLNNLPADSVQMTLGGVQVQAAVSVENVANQMTKSLLDLFA